MSHAEVRTLRTACEPCRKRKNRCTGERPTCSRCQRLNVACVYMERTMRKTAGQAGSPGSPARRSRSPVLSMAPRHPSTSNGPTPTLDVSISPYDVRATSSHDDRRGIAARDFSTDTGRSPSPVYVVPQLPVGSQLSTTIGAVPEFVPSLQHTRVTSWIQIDPHTLPSESSIFDLIDHFASFTNAAFPIVHMPTLRDLAREALEGHRMASVDACLLLLTLALAAKSLPNRPGYRRSREDYAGLLAKAKELLPPAYHGSPNQQKLQIRLLHLQYTLYDPTEGSNIWELAGSAMRMAIDLEYHHERSTSNCLPFLERDMRRRLFWSAYCIDRNLSITLGRPPAIPDTWINAQMFSASSDELLTSLSPSNAFESTLTHPASSVKASALHHVRIRRLQSEIQERLYRLPQNTDGTSDIDLDHITWSQRKGQQVAEWRSTAYPATGFCSTTWLDLNYHVTLTLLYRPSPRNPKPSKEELIMARKGASGVMRTYKEMFRSGRINFGWLSMYQLFIAGIAYLNSLWQAADQGWTIVPSYVEALLDVQVCTSVMSSLSATTPGFSTLCTAFETLSEKIIRQLTSRASWATISRNPSPAPHQHASTPPPLAVDHHSLGISGDVAYMPQPGWPVHDTAYQETWATTLESESQNHIDDFLAGLGIGGETQDTFDSLFLHPLPDLPSHYFET